jgi:hypothetical protein
VVACVGRLLFSAPAIWQQHAGWWHPNLVMFNRMLGGPANCMLLAPCIAAVCGWGQGCKARELSVWYTRRGASVCGGKDLVTYVMQGGRWQGSFLLRLGHALACI